MLTVPSAGSAGRKPQHRACQVPRTLPQAHTCDSCFLCPVGLCSQAGHTWGRHEWSRQSPPGTTGKDQPDPGAASPSPCAENAGPQLRLPESGFWGQQLVSRTARGWPATAPGLGLRPPPLTPSSGRHSASPCVGIRPQKVDTLGVMGLPCRAGASGASPTQNRFCLTSRHWRLIRASRGPRRRPVCQASFPGCLDPMVACQAELRASGDRGIRAPVANHGHPNRIPPGCRSGTERHSPMTLMTPES